MKVSKEKEAQKEERILARIMSKEISQEQLERAAGSGGFTLAGTCSVGPDED